MSLQFEKGAKYTQILWEPQQATGNKRINARLQRYHHEAE